MDPLTGYTDLPTMLEAVGSNQGLGAACINYMYAYFNINLNTSAITRSTYNAYLADSGKELLESLLWNGEPSAWSAMQAMTTLTACLTSDQLTALGAIVAPT